MRCAPWLPRKALLDESLPEALSVCAHAWARHWLPQTPRIDVCRIDAPSIEAHQTWRLGELSLLHDTPPALALLMLGLVQGGQKTRSADEALFARLGARAAKDLLARCWTLFGSGVRPPMTTGPRVHDDTGDDLTFAVRVGEATMFHIVVPSGLAAHARRSLLPTYAPDNTPHSRNAAISDIEVSVGAMIGLGCMPLTEMRTLSIGDVIVLDRGQDDPLELAINGARVADAACAIGARNGRITLSLLPSSAAHESLVP